MTRHTATLLTAALTAVLLGLFGAWLAAADQLPSLQRPSVEQPTAPKSSGQRVQAVWDGPTALLNWEGGGYVRAEASFVGQRVASPGDYSERTLKFKNAGPDQAVASVVVFAEGQDAEAFSEHLTLFWKLGQAQGEEKFSTLRSGQPIAQLVVPQGQESALRMGFKLDPQVDQHLAGTLSFEVALVLAADTVSGPSTLADTGAEIWMFLLLALLSVCLGLWLVMRRKLGPRQELG